MTSFGEAILSAAHLQIGTLRITAISPSPAVFPRLSVRVAIELREVPGSTFWNGRHGTDFELRDIRGELRLGQYERTVATLWWSGAGGPLLSSPHGATGTFELTADLDGARLDAIEQVRDGGPMRLWLELWPVVVHSQENLRAAIPAFSIDVPRDTWIATLNALTGVRRVLFEAIGVGLSGVDMRPAIDCLLRARHRIDRGEYDDAILDCRRALEAAYGSFGTRPGKRVVERALDGVVPLANATAYDAVAAALWDLGSGSAHKTDVSQPHLRSEALFTVGVTEHLVGLLSSSLLRRVVRTAAQEA